jgi:hypothetical protein
MSRPAAVTPLEYQLMLVNVFPGWDDELTLLTRAYLTVRYGEFPETVGEATAVANTWARLKFLKSVGGTRMATRCRRS